MAQRPRYIGPASAFKSLTLTNLGKIDEFVSLFRRLSNQSKVQAPYVFASIDKDDSGEVTYAEFAQEWDTIYAVLKNDIELDELYNPWFICFLGECFWTKAPWKKSIPVMQICLGGGKITLTHTNVKRI